MSKTSLQNTRMENIAINIRGTRFEINQEMLNTMPMTTSAFLDKSSEYFNSEKNEYFFNRDPEVFNSILNFFVFKELHIPRHICGAVVREELKFWRIPEQLISQCCWNVFYRYDEDKAIYDKLDNYIVTTQIDPNEKYNWKGSARLVTDPKFSTPALVWHYFFICIVLLSTLVFCFWTIPAFRRSPYLYQMPEPNPNETTMELNAKLINIVILDAKPEILVLEGICLLIFVLDLLINIILCPRKSQFFKDGSNLIQLTVVVLMSLSYSMEFLKGQMAGKTEMGYIYFFAKALNMIRIFLFIRLERTFQAFRVLLLALRASGKELALMVFSFAVLTLFYSSVIFYCEIYGENFYNIFICMWWAIVTMTTVGYGDYSPTTTPGYIVGVACAMSGIVLISMPVAVIASNFSAYYRVYRSVQMHQKAGNDAAARK